MNIMMLAILVLPALVRALPQGLPPPPDLGPDAEPSVTALLSASTVVASTALPLASAIPALGPYTGGDRAYLFQDVRLNH
jgi:hypothetical protein